MAESEWQQWVVGNRSFRPELTFLVTPDDDAATIVAYLMTKEFGAATAVTGKREAYIDRVGTLPEHRGRGLASALLRHALAAQQEAGYDEAALDVDTLNPTGALSIYEAAGFARERTFAMYVKVLR
jgi:ribosomal protein S18 acetylase RimI-like enzyme